MSVQNGERLATKQDLADMYQGILPYLGGMPEMVANKFSKGDLYSTDEKMIGQWTDGKPLYQRTYTVTVPKDTSEITISLDSDLETAVSWYGVLKSNYTDGSGNDYTLYIPHSEGTNTMYGYVRTGTHTFGLIRKTDWNGTAYITVRYTKTTDTAIAIGEETEYSTTEKIVGTWVDGKPVYQKTFIHTTPLVTSTAIGNIPNFESLVNVNGSIKQADGNVVELNTQNTILWIDTSDDGGGTDFGGVYLAVSGSAINAPYTFVTIQYTKAN